MQWHCFRPLLQIYFSFGGFVVFGGGFCLHGAESFDLFGEFEVPGYFGTVVNKGFSLFTIDMLKFVLVDVESNWVNFVPARFDKEQMNSKWVVLIWELI